MNANIKKLVKKQLMDNETAQECIQRKTTINQRELDKAKKSFYDLIEQSKKGAKKG